MQTLPKPPNGTSVTAVEPPIPARELAVGRPLAVVLGLGLVGKRGSGHPAAVPAAKESVP